MTPEAQQYLAQQVAFMRQEPGHTGGRVDAANTALAHFGTALRALQAVGAVTQEEFDDWMGRARDASGWDAVTELRRRARAGIVHPAAASTHEEPPFPRFVRLVPAPNEEYEFHGGRIRIIGVEVFDTQMILHWRMAPPPDMDLAFPEVAEAEEQETDGLPVEERAKFRWRRVSRNWHILGAFQIADDAGNTYDAHASFGSSGSITVGQHVITPALRDGATALVVDALGFRIAVPLLTSPG